MRKPRNKTEYDEIKAWLEDWWWLKCDVCGVEWKMIKKAGAPYKRCNDCEPEFKAEQNRQNVNRWRKRHAQA